MSFNVAMRGVSNRDEPEGDIKLYIRNDGSDAGAGTLASPLLTLQEAYGRLITRPGGDARQVIEATGFTNQIDTSGLGFVDGFWFTTPDAGARYDFDLARSGTYDDGKADNAYVPIEIMADPSFLMDLTVVSVATYAGSGIPIITVSEALTPGALVGLVVNMPGTDGRFGLITANTGNTVEVASTTSAWSGTLKVWNKGATFDCSHGGFNFDVRSPLIISNIDFLQAITVQAHARFSITKCRVPGFTVGNGGARMSCNYNYFDNGVHAVLGGQMDGAANLFAGTDFQVHGTVGGFNKERASVFDGCDPVFSGNYEAQVDIEFENSIIRNGTSHGIIKESPVRMKIADCDIYDNAGDGILAETGGGEIKIRNVVGTGNGGAGMRLKNGAQCLDQASGNAITGTDGEVIVGGSAASLWADAKPRDDGAEAAPEFCRIYS